MTKTDKELCAGYGSQPIAVTGMTVRVPRGEDTEAFWHLVESGDNAVRRLTPEELANAGVPEDLIQDPDYCPFAAPLEQAEYFDHERFALSKQEASRMDPQHRVFLQCACSALENAGHVPQQVVPLTGVFASARFSMRLAQGLDLNSRNSAEVLQQVIGSDKDYLATRVSYLMDLKGPSMTVQSACSSSLLAVHLAIQSLLTGECDMALAGGVTINEPQHRGYLRQEGMIFSTDGVCRPFDARATGTVGGNGCGVVVLRRLEDALAAGERIIAVIRGSAVNNDGAAKIGYTAPGISGQVRVLREAMAVAEVEPETISYIETHGTGTSLGDPIEFQALSEAFNVSSESHPFCALGSVKANIGHLDAAAGVVSLIKTLLALKHRRIPVMANFTEMNPRISLAGQPFYIPHHSADWPEVKGVRRAGVSSFGFGGTNVHLQLEEWRAPDTVLPVCPDHPLSLLISAGGEVACRTLAARWATLLRQADFTTAQHACYEALFARARHKTRLALVAAEPEALCQGLKAAINGEGSNEEYTIYRGEGISDNNACAWIFGGQEPLHQAQIQGWYQRGEVFRKTLERCSQLAADQMDISFSELLLDEHQRDTRLLQPSYAQPALFVLQMALAEQWRALGITPVAVLGHSLGEFAAACVAGCLTLEQGLALVLERGRLVEQMEAGNMLALNAPKTVRQTLLADLAVDLAAENTPETLVYSGKRGDLTRLEMRAQQAGCWTRWLTINRAMHSRHMDSAVQDFRVFSEIFGGLKPKIPFYSTVTGKQLLSAPDAEYWGKHLRQPVLFHRTLIQLQSEHPVPLLEIGVDNTLCRLIRSHQSSARCVSSLNKRIAPAIVADSAIAALYVHGIEINWEDLWHLNWRRCLTLPDTPFTEKLFSAPAPAPRRELASCILSFSGITHAAGQQALRGLPLLELSRFKQGKAQLEQLSKTLIQKALAQTFPVLCGTTPQHLDQLLVEGEIVTSLHQYVTRLIRSLATQGEIQQTDNGKYFSLHCPSEADLAQIGEQSAFIWQRIPQLRNAYLKTAEALPDILRGHCSALAVMHRSGSLDNALSIYSDTPTSRYFNAILREALRAVITSLPTDYCLRVLEIGAGSGATARRLLPLMDPVRSEYWFTDVTPHFVSAAREQLVAEYPFARFQIYDAATPGEAADIAPGSMDVVIAVNVLHALADLERALASIERILVPGGILLLYELTEASFAAELSTGVLIGTVTDTLRGHQVFIDVSVWRAGLQARGFDQVACFPEPGSEADCAGEHVLVARKTGHYQPRQALELTPTKENYFYGWRWDHTDRAHTSLATDCWILLPDEYGQVNDWAQCLQQRGETVVLARSDEQITDLLSCYQRPVLLIATGGGNEEGGEEDALAQHQCLRLLRLVSVLYQSGKPVPLAGWYIVTCGAADGLRHYSCASQSSVQGLARVIDLGHPELMIRLLDIDISATPEQVVTALQSGQKWQALDQGQRYQPALCPQPPVLIGDALCFGPQESALIVGGTGGIGSQLACHLAQKGIGTLILTARHPQDISPQLRHYPVRVIIRAVDVTDEAAMQALFQEIHTTCPPLTAVFHCAVDSRISTDDVTEPTQLFSRVIAPKVKGGWLLHKLTASVALRYFVLFSSSVSMLPSYGLPHYVAANAFLDGLAGSRRAQGLHALSISWGAWRDVGVVGGAEQIRRLERGGLRAFAVSDALALLDQALQTDIAHCGIIDMDWAAFLRQFPDDALPVEYQSLQVAQQHVPEDHSKRWQAPGLAQQLRAVSPQQQHHILECYLTQGFASLLGRDETNFPGDVNLMELGIDSLMFLDASSHISHALQINLSANALFSDFTLNGITAQMMRALSDDEADSLPDLIQADKENLHQPFPLSDVQQAYWVGRSETMGLGNVSCYGYSEFDCDKLDIPRLEQAWNRVITRHDMLRAIIRHDTQQVILPEVPFYRIKTEDLRHLSPQERDIYLQQRRQQLSHQVRATDQWPLFDIQVSRLSDNACRLHFGLDNIMTDGRSIDILIQELVNLYSDRPVAPVPQISFRDYQIALQAYYQSAEYARSRDYWLERLDEIYPAPQLPLVSALENIQAPRFVRRSFCMDSARWQKLRGFAAQHAGLTPSGLLLAAFSEVLACWSDDPRFTLNLPTFNRQPLHPEVNSVVGEFTSVILLSVDAGAHGSFSDRARYVQQRLIQDLRHESFSGVRVIRELVRQRAELQTVRMPVVFTSTFGLSCETDELHARREQGVRLFGHEVYSISQTPQVLLDSHVHDHNGELQIHWDCVDEAFKPGVLPRMFGMFTQLLEALVDSPQTWQSETPLTLSEPEQALWQSYNDTEVSQLVAPQQTLLSQFIARCQQTPQAVALICGDRQICYGDLALMAQRIAGALAAKALSPGQPVGIMLEKSVEQIAAVLGVLLAGAAYVPLNPDYPRQRLQSIVEQFDDNMPILTFGDHLRTWAGAIDITQALVQAPLDLHARCHPDHLAYVIFTSGTSGTPKGVEVDHRAALTTINDINRRLAVNSQDVALGVSSLSFDLSVYDIFGLLSCGACLVLPDEGERLEPQAWLQLIARHQVTLWNSAPVYLQMLLDEPGSGLHLLKRVLISGDWIALNLPEKLRERAPEAAFYSLGGATEAAIWSVFYPVTQVEAGWNSIPYGYPLSNQRLYVADSRGQLKPPGISGELWIAGDGLARGYWRDKARTDVAFTSFPGQRRAYRTGDRARLNEDGVMEFLGRVDNQVKVRGYRIEPGDVESALRRCHGVDDALVVARKTPGNSNYTGLIAYLVVYQDARMEIAALRRQLSQWLPDWMIPGYWVMLDSWPVTANGKIDRQALPVPQVCSAAVQEQEKSGSELEHRLLALLSAALNVPQLTTQTHLFEAGFDSLALARASVSLREAGFAVSLRDFFLYPCVSQLAASIEQAKGTPSHGALYKKAVNGGKQIVCLHGAAGNGDIFAPLCHGLPVDWGYQIPELTPPATGTLQDWAMALADTLNPQPDVVIGHSAGGLLAWQLVSVLQRRGQPVSRLLMIDSMPLRRDMGEPVQAFAHLNGINAIPVQSLDDLFRQLKPEQIAAAGGLVLLTQQFHHFERFLHCVCEFEPEALPTTLCQLLLASQGEPSQMMVKWLQVVDLDIDLDIDLITGDHLSCLRGQGLEQIHQILTDNLQGEVP
ncbi:amino acid adenylation domain-containing protein [Salmonella enterica subsp. enterica serovar Javiana]|nr:amino acid adenylation domain-containing protein [Salmonella enterica subsp. enterica serovar Javiana]ELD4653739.1 amino acid adenylation domain-containing protein [Salmonella enterica subsp. enterica serovar Javiana]